MKLEDSLEMKVHNIMSLFLHKIHLIVIHNNYSTTQDTPGKVTCFTIKRVKVMMELELKESEHFHLVPTLLMTLWLRLKWKPYCSRCKQN